jgi:hypothetical protein
VINPTVGRVVLFHPDAPHDQPFAATIAYVHSDRMVNLSVIDANGFQFSKNSVTLIQDDDAYPAEYCEWMPYQKGQAAKTEALESKLQATEDDTRG